MNLYKIAIVVFVLLTLQLQYRLWFGDGGHGQIEQYQQRLSELQQEVRHKKQRNQLLYAEVLDLRKDEEAIEERARYELGMIKTGETFFQVIE